MGHDGLFHQILNLLHRRAAAHFLAADLHALGDPLDLQGGHADGLLYRLVGLGHSHDDLVNVKHRLGTVSFDNLHCSSPPILSSAARGRRNPRLCSDGVYYTIYCGYCKTQSTIFIKLIFIRQKRLFIQEAGPVLFRPKSPAGRGFLQNPFEFCLRMRYTLL